MTPDGRMAWALGATLVLWSPAAWAVATGSMDLVTGGIIFLAALAVSWLGSGMVSMIIGNYSRSNEQLREAKRQIELLEERAATTQRRRETDKRQESGSDHQDHGLSP